MARTTWDVWVVLANDPSQLISYVPRWRSIQFSDQLNDTGSATVEHDFTDPYFAAFQLERGDSLLDGPYALQIRRDGYPVFTFFIEDVQVDRSGFNQPLTIGGRGIAAALEWGIVLPEDFTNQARATAGTTQRPRFFDRLFPGYSFNVRVATTANIAATYANGPQVDVAGAGARLTATANGSINNSGIDGVTDLVVGDTALVKNQTNAAHNGIYWIVSIGSANTPFVLQRTAQADGTPISDLEVGDAAFVEEGTLNGYHAFKILTNGSLSSSNQIGTVEIVWDAVTLGSFTGISAFYILFLEADTGYEYSTKKDDFGTIKTLNGRGGIGYAVDWPLSLDAQIDSTDGKTDSNGRVVKDGGNFNIAVGRTLLDVLNEVCTNTGADWHVNPEGEISIAIRPFVSNTVVFDGPFGNDLTSASAALLFTLPMLETVETRTSVSERRTVVYGSDGFNLDRQISEQTGTYGFRELFIENTSEDAPAVANITSAAARQVKDGKLQITATFVEKDGLIAWTNFDIGDKVLVEIDVGVYGQRIISAISASVDDSGNETIEVTFGDIFQDMATNLKYAANFGRLSAAEIPAFTLRGTSSRPTAPTGTSVGAAVSGMSNRVIVNWESPDNTSATQYEAIVYREEQSSASATFGVQITYAIDDIYRDGNRAFVEVDDDHNFSIGDYVNIYDTTDSYFDRTMVFLTSASGHFFTFDDVGPDIPSGTYSAGEVARVVERHSTMVPSNKTSAAFENLAAPGREYQFTILPYAANGQSGVPSPPFTFTASASAQVLFNGAIRSNNYVTNVSGWTIEAAGDAELNSVTIRNGAFVQGTMTAATIQTGTTNPRVIVDSAGLRAFNNAGDIVTSVSASTGALFSSSASISGNVTANSLTANATITSPVITGGTIDIGGNDATSFHVDSSGNMFLGAATFATAPFNVSSTGSVTAVAGSIAGFDFVQGTNLMHTGGSFLGTLSLGLISGDGSAANSRVGLEVKGPQPPGRTLEAQYDYLTIFREDTGSNVTLTPEGDIIASGEISTTDLTVANTINGSINGTASNADNADALAGYSADFNDGNFTVPIRGSDASIRAGFLVMLGSDTIGSSTGAAVRKRNDGYLLTVSSRREIKNSIEDIGSDFAYSIINALQPVSFRFNEQQYIGDLFSEREAEYREYGFIAQDVGEVNSNLVSYSVNAEGDGIQPSMWSDFALISLSVSAIKGLITEIEDLKNRLMVLESGS